MKIMESNKLKQAKIWLNRHTGWRDLENVKVCRRAIEKQIPKELTIKTTDEKIRYTCPCGKTLIVEYKNSLIFGTKTKYCPECGQALDWGKEQWKNA